MSGSGFDVMEGVSRRGRPDSVVGLRPGLSNCEVGLSGAVVMIGQLGSSELLGLPEALGEFPFDPFAETPSGITPGPSGRSVVGAPAPVDEPGAVSFEAIGEPVVNGCSELPTGPAAEVPDGADELGLTPLEAIGESPEVGCPEAPDWPDIRGAGSVEVSGLPPVDPCGDPAEDGCSELPGRPGVWETGAVGEFELAPIDARGEAWEDVWSELPT